MGFRIRSDSDDEAIRDASMRRYREHLKNLDQETAANDLRQYFYWDFFHDGWIEEIVFRNGTAEVQVPIVCPNIKRKTVQGAWEYINVPFLCVFKDVVYFSFGRAVEEETDYGDPGQFTYLSSEIDTLPDLTRFQSKDDNYSRKHSLIIEVMPARARCSSFIEVIFRDVVVQAVESVAFQLMLASSDFEVPLYNEQENP